MSIPTVREGVWAIVVTYRSNREQLLRLLEAVAPQVEGLVVVDNGSSDEFVEWVSGCASAASVQLIRFPDNKGIAAAQNAGIADARERGAKFVVLFDHDSVPAPDMVRRLVRATTERQAAGIEVGAVGPRYLDVRQNNPPPFIRFDGVWLKRYGCSEPDAVVEVSYLIASGSLIPTHVLDVVGGMREDLFIDYVDIEWGLRASRQGYRCFGVCGATMTHDLGEEPIRFLGRNIPLHSPLRHYYHFRNAVCLYREGSLPMRWKLADGWRLVLKYGFYTLFARPQHRHWWMMTKGLWHGLTGQTGKYR